MQYRGCGDTPRNRTLRVGALSIFALATCVPAIAQEDARVMLANGRVRLVAPAVTTTTSAIVSRNTKPLLSVSSVGALDKYARYFGIQDPTSELRALSAKSLGKKGDVIRYTQLYQHVPIAGAGLVMRLDGAGQLLSLSGETSTDLALPTVTPKVTPQAAQLSAAQVVNKQHNVPIAGLVASEPELEVYDPKLIGAEIAGPVRLVWRIEVTTVAKRPVREFVLIDAETGGLVLNFNQAADALALTTYTANFTSSRPGTFLCDESNPACTNGINLDADAAHAYAADTYKFYLSHHGRDSFDGAGAGIVSTVQWTDGVTCPNAFWDGTQMTYCDGASRADDIVAHELTHAVTDATSNLFYFYQSGAINESLSDVWGEFVDLTNGKGTDTPTTRWQIGEDYAPPGAVRNMANPALFSDPDRMSSPFYWNAPQDNGGVHSNSGVNNKAVSLMVDGGTFNGFSITGIGLEKVAAIYYRVQTEHLTSGSDYADLALAVTQACQNLIGNDGITGNDCAQVSASLNAVEMNQAPAMDAGSEAALCGTGQIAKSVIFDNFEVLGSSRWMSLPAGSPPAWNSIIGYASSGGIARASFGSAVISDQSLTLASPVEIPANARLHFRHAYEQELGFDGGVVEYSLDGGSTWSDAASLYSAGKHYTGSLQADNPLAGRQAFSGSSHGYVSTRYDLSSLANQTVLFRFRRTTDSSVSSNLGWFVDDVRIYTCVSDAVANALPVASVDHDLTVRSEQDVSLSPFASSDSDGEIVSMAWKQISGQRVAFNNLGWLLRFRTPITPVQDQLVFRLTVTDDRGASATDDVTVTVTNAAPVTSAGADQTWKPRTSVSLLGWAVDTDGTIARQTWSQVAGPAVALTSTSGATTSFVAPSVATSALLTFRLTAIDNYGGTSSDDVDVHIVNETPLANAGQDSSVEAGASVTLTGSAIDPDGTITSYQWQQISGPTVGVSSTSGLNLAFTAPSQKTASTLVFRLTATDNDGGTGTDDVLINVAAKPQKSGGGGGGAFSVGLLALLWGLAAMRRRFVRHC